jgi:hypothetical protein
MKVDIWQETKYKTNATIGGLAILIQSHLTTAEAVGFLIALS